MPDYIRSRHAGGTYFFTARTARRGSDVLLRDIAALRCAMRRTRARYPFEVDEIVVLGDVIHTLWTLPEGDSDYSTRWRMLKSLFSRACSSPDDVADMRLRPREKGIWQRRFWEHRIRDSRDLEAHRHLILCAPVQAGLVNRPEQWAHSSIHRAIARGTYVPQGIGAAYGSYDGGRTARAPYRAGGVQ